MTLKDGFIGGAVAGALLTLFATGHLVTITYTDQIRNLSWLFLFFLFFITQFLTVYRVFEGRSYFGTTGDGVILGISFSEGLIVFILYGFRL